MTHDVILLCTSDRDASKEGRVGPGAKLLSVVRARRQPYILIARVLTVVEREPKHDRQHEGSTVVTDGKKKRGARYGWAYREIGEPLGEPSCGIVPRLVRCKRANGVYGARSGCERLKIFRVSCNMQQSVEQRSATGFKFSCYSIRTS